MHKYKLKKDDKVVGYAFIGNGQVITARTQKDLIWAKENCASYSVGLQLFEWDTACPFVCLDKNGDEVYAGDKIMGKFEKGGVDFEDTATVIWDKDDCAYLLKLDTYVLGRPGYWTIGDENIELIKE